MHGKVIMKSTRRKQRACFRRLLPDRGEKEQGSTQGAADHATVVKEELFLAMWRYHTKTLAQSLAFHRITF